MTKMPINDTHDPLFTLLIFYHGGHDIYLITSLLRYEKLFSLKRDLTKLITKSV